jgi:hypothetical protein
MNDAPVKDKISPSDSVFEVTFHSVPDDRRQSKEIEGVITNIRNQLRKRHAPQSSSGDIATDYQFGESVQFGLGGKGLQHLGSGWHVAELTFSWTEGVYAFLHFGLPLTNGDLMLEFTANGYINSQILFQDVTIEINGIPCCRIPVSKKYTFSMVVPRSTFAGSRQLAVRFSCPSRASPSQFKRGADHRVLGIALHSLIIRELLIQRPPGELRPEAPPLSSRVGHAGEKT